MLEGTYRVAPADPGAPPPPDPNWVERVPAVLTTVAATVRLLAALAGHEPIGAEATLALLAAAGAGYAAARW